MKSNEFDHTPRTEMRPPKILPWLARSAGLTMGQAESIWHAAVRDTQAKSLQPDGTSGYWRDLLCSLRAGIARAANKWSTRRHDRDFEARRPIAFDLFEVQRQITHAALAPWTEFLENYALRWSRQYPGRPSTRG